MKTECRYADNWSGAQETGCLTKRGAGHGSAAFRFGFDEPQCTILILHTEGVNHDQA